MSDPHDSDVEARLALLLNESVDARLGPRRAAPPFVAPPADTAHDGDEIARRRRRRFTFLAVAATVAAVLAAALTLALYSPGRDRPPPTGPTLKSVRLGGATIVLPSGWVARPYSRYLPTGEDNNFGKQNTVCLTPRRTPVGTGVDSCPVQFARLGSGLMLEADTQGGVQSDPEYCFQGRDLGRDTVSAAIRSFGGRESVFYREDITCTKSGEGGPIDYAQYEVLGDPAYILYASKATPAIRTAMQFVVEHAQLPPQTSALWREDLGRITAVSGSGSDVHLQLARLYRAGHGATRTYGSLDGERAGYTVTSKQLQTGAIYGPIRVGSVVLLTTDGSRVTSVLGQPG